MKGFHPHRSKLFVVLFIGLAVLLGLLVEQQLRERIQPKPLQVPTAELSNAVAPIRADGPLHEIREQAWAQIGAQPRWTF